MGLMVRRELRGTERAARHLLRLVPLSEQHRPRSSPHHGRYVHLAKAHTRKCCRPTVDREGKRRFQEERREMNPERGRGGGPSAHVAAATADKFDQGRLCDAERVMGTETSSEIGCGVKEISGCVADTSERRLRVTRFQTNFDTTTKASSCASRVHFARGVEDTPPIEKDVAEWGAVGFWVSSWLTGATCCICRQ